MLVSLHKRITLFLLLAAFCTTISAQVIYVKQDAAGANDGSSWADAYTDFASAVDAAMVGNELWVAAGTYKPGGMMPDTNSFFVLKDEISIYGGFAGTESALSERDVENNATIFSGDINGDDVAGNLTMNRVDNVKHIFFLMDGSTSALTVLDGCTFSGGHAYNSPEGEDTRRGGGILNYSALTIRNCLFVDNFGWFGGAMYPRFGGATGTVIENCEFRNNGAGSGGAMYINSLDTIAVSDCIFEGNTCENNGGAVYNQASALSYTNCDFTANICGIDDRGGAMYNTGSDIIITDCDFEMNVATRTGGAISSTGDSTRVIMQNCEFSANQSRWGGALTNYGTNSLYLISDCEFLRNLATQAGGAMSCGFKADVQINNCEFDRNNAGSATNDDGPGGAIFTQNDTTSVMIRSSDFTNNVSLGSGGAFFTGVDSPVSLTDCLFESNQGSVGGAVAFNADSSEIAPFTATNCVFAFNVASDQGGAINIGNGDTRIVSCLFDTNIASGVGTGGAISNNASPNQNSPLFIINSTFSGNIGILSAGIAQWTDTVNNSAVMTLQNNIFSNPDGVNYAIEDGSPTIVSMGGNLSSDDSFAAALAGTNDLNSVDPLFEDATVSDFNLQENSPAVNAGISAGAPLTDILGNARVDSVDMGAYESPYSPTGTIDLEDNRALQLSPNPVDEQVQLYIENEWNGPLDVRVTNVKGQIVATYRIDKWQRELRHELNLGQLDTGIYQISVSNGNSMLVRSLIKQ
ncbi:MAG: choice-of-anchor Q domain-containing protein [Bacteroidota bacterium]